MHVNVGGEMSIVVPVLLVVLFELPLSSALHDFAIIRRKVEALWATGRVMVESALGGEMICSPSLKSARKASHRQLIEPNEVEAQLEDPNGVIHVDHKINIIFAAGEQLFQVDALPPNRVWLEAQPPVKHIHSDLR